MSEERMTWGEFKKKVEAQGLKDEDIVTSIDVWHFNNIKVEQVGGGIPWHWSGYAIEDG